MSAAIRSYSTSVNWGKVLLYTAAILTVFILLANPALAQSNNNAFGDLQNTLTTQTCNAFETGQTILYVAAVVALLVGVAPMLWGQVKVKWLVSCLVATVLFAIIPTVINAFSGNNAATCAAI